MRLGLRSLALLTAGVLGAGGIAAGPAGAATQAGPPGRAGAAAGKAHSVSHLSVLYRGLHLLNGDTATVYSNGLAEVWNASHSKVEYRTVPPDGQGQAGTAAALPGRAQLSFDLLKAPAQPYVAGQFEMVLSGTVSAGPSITVPAATLARLQRHTPRPGALPAGAVPAYTSDAAFNRVLAGLGVDRMTAVFPRAAVRPLRTPPGRLDLAKAYVVRMTSATMPHALAALSGSGAVAYAAPDWTVTSTATSPLPVRSATLRAAASAARQLRRAPAARRSGPSLPPLPSNYTLASSAQSLLNKPGVDWAPAYETLESKYHQLPGTGEVITDVSLGDLDSAGIAPTDPCSGYVSAFGPTTILQNGQRYLDWPSMPLIPTYVSSSTATVNPAGEVCGEDPFDTEIGLDFAMMAPLPDGMQRAGETGAGLTDLLGIAPGAKYRLVVPADTTGSVISVDQAFLAAAQQTPRPNVITASLAFGEDSYGFPSRYLEDDPLTEALITSLVRQYHITVSVSANDGLRTSTNAPVAPSGGSAATDTAAAGHRPSNLNSIYLSTGPSRDYDSGAIDAGGTTLDDVFAAPPQDPANAALDSQHAFPETRWDGYGSFSSGYGSRVNLSAPGDNLLAFEHPFGGAPDAVTVDNIGGTSASSQEIGAAAAVVQQAARLAGDKSVASNPLALRTELENTATPVPGVSQADGTLNVGPQVDLGQAVTAVTGGLAPGVARVAVEQRQPTPGYLDGVFSTATDPGDISLSGGNQNGYITISPDWVGLPAGATYQLSALRENGGRRLLASGPWARLQPGAIFRAAGVAPPSTQTQAVALSYTASAGGRILARATIPLSFAAVSGTPDALAPVVPPVVTGGTIPVRYNITGQTSFTAPQLVVSAPGRMNPLDDHFFRDMYTVPLTKTSGTVDVPVSALQGGGMYGVAVQAAPDSFQFTDFAYTRVQDAASDVRPAAPVLAAPGSPAGYLLTVPYHGTFSVSWNVSQVPGAAGAYLEISAPGPNDFNSFATFNNPNGSIRDDNGYDSGSVYYAKLPGTSGKMTVSSATAGLIPTMYSNVRVLPVTAAGTAAGEASDVSTISMNGVAPADGGAPVDGFGVDATGSTGFVTSNGAVSATGEPVSSVESFSQRTNAITGTVLSSTNSDSYSTPDDGGAGMFAGHTGLVNDSTASTSSYAALHPVGTVAGPWDPPTSNTSIQPADNQQTSSAAFGTWTNGGQGVQDAGVFTSNVRAGTFGPVYPIQSALSGFTLPVLSGVAQDTATGTAVVAGSDFTNLSAPPTFITVNLANGATSSFAGVGSGIPDGVAVDSATGTAVSPEQGNVAGLYDLATGAGTVATPGGNIYQHPAVDATHHYFVMQEVSSPDENLVAPGLGAVPNDNALSSMVTLNEQGQLVSRAEQCNFFNVFMSIAAQATQLEPASQRGYTLGLDGDGLQPFGY